MEREGVQKENLVKHENKMNISERNEYNKMKIIEKK